MGPASGSLGGRPLRGASSSPDTPCCSERCTQMSTTSWPQAWRAAISRNSETTVGEQDQVGAQGHAPDGLPTDGAEFLPVALCQMNVHQWVDLLLSQAAKFMPKF